MDLNTEPGRGSNKRVLTLCGTQGCCPTVELDPDNNTVTIKDDFGGTVKLTTDEWRSAMEQMKA